MTRSAATALLLGALLLVFLGEPFTPTHDGPHHLASCVLGAELARPGSPLDTYLTQGSALSGVGFQALCVPVVRLFGWRLGHQLLLFLISALFALGFAFLARGLDRETPMWPAGFVFVFPWVMEMGFYPFALALGLAPWLLGWAARRPEPRWPEWLGWSAAVLLLTVIHGFGGALAGLNLGLLVVARERGGRRRSLRALQAAASSAPALLLLLLVRRGFTGGEVPVEPDLLASPALFAQVFIGGAAWRSWPPLLFALAALALATRTALRGALPPAARGLLLGSWVCLAAFFVAPLNLPGWSYFSPRLLSLSLGLAPALSPAPARLRRYLEPALVLLALGTLAGLHLAHRPLRERVEEVVRLSSIPLHRPGVRLPIMMSEWTSPVWAQDPLGALGHLVLFAQGGVDPYLWADEPALDAILFRPELRALFPPAPGMAQSRSLECSGCPSRDWQAQFFAFLGRRYADVFLLADDPRMKRAFLDRGYRLLAERGRAVLLEPDRCAVGVRILAPGLLATAAPLRFRLGWAGLEEAAVEHTIPAGTALVDGALPVFSHGPDCGALWIEVADEQGRSVCGAPRLEIRAAPGGEQQVDCPLSAPASAP